FALREPLPGLPSLPVEADGPPGGADTVAGLELDGWDSVPFAAERASDIAATAPEPPGELELDTDLLEGALGGPQPEREEDLVTEAEVLAKYGLEDKAIERLSEALRLRPDHLSAYALLIQIHLDHGRHGEVMALANRMSAVAAGREPWLRMRK